jgi:hypothetical protein
VVNSYRLPRLLVLVPAVVCPDTALALMFESVPTYEQLARRDSQQSVPAVHWSVPAGPRYGWAGRTRESGRLRKAVGNSRSLQREPRAFSTLTE